ncbi:hypothetical protein V1508DRAFT_416720 [Lipomyces doorenjongii]|uniref:uncharacterized protein n=1 Tax=Lipomyces doorenjongii TaxID=383834 RepID=UPI0034CDF185
MVGTTSPNHRWTTRKCHRVVRPLSSKLQSLRNLIGSHPSLVNHAGGHGHSSAGNGNISEQTATWEKRNRTHSGNIKKYSVKLSQSQSKSSSLPSRHRASVQESDKSSQYCADNLLLSLRDKTTPAVYAAYRSIFHAFHHFMLQTYESPATLSQKSAIELGKCVVYTLGSVSEDDWYDGMEVLKYYKRFIAIGHGVSLVARDAEFCRHLLPALIVDCAEMEAFDMGLLLLRSLLEVTAIDDILVNYDMFCTLSGLVKSSPYILLQYIMSNLSVEQIIHSNLLEILNSLLANPIYNIYSRDISLRNMLCHIFATGRREVRRSSHPQFKQVESAMLGISSIICRHPAVFDVSFITRVINTIGPAKARFTSAWQLLCIHQFYLGHINHEFVQYFYAPSTTPSASFRIHSRLRVALLDIYRDLEGQIRPIIERILQNVPKFAVALATVFAAKSRDSELLRLRGDVERCAMQLDSGLRTKNWVHDESLEEWVEVREDSGRAFSLISDSENVDELAGHVVDSLSDISDELEAIDDEQLTAGNISSQMKSCMTSPAIYEVDSKSTIPTSPVTVACQSRASRLLHMLPPPSSVVKLTPRSNRRIRDKYFRLLSTPATGGCTVDRRRPNWFPKSKSTTIASDEEEIEYQDDSDEFENASPLQGRKRLGSSDHDHPAKKSRGCTTSYLASEVSRLCSRRNSPDFIEAVEDELSMAVSLDWKRLRDLTNYSRDAVKKTTSNTSSSGHHRKGRLKGRKMSSEQENNVKEEDDDELFALKGVSYAIDSSSRL